MSRSYNYVTLIGTLSAAPEIKTSQAGKQYGKIIVYTEDAWADKDDGEMRVRYVHHHPVIIFGDELCDFLAQHGQPETPVHVVGKLQSSSYMTPKGEERYSTTVVVTRYTGHVHILQWVRDMYPLSFKRPHGNVSVAHA